MQVVYSRFSVGRSRHGKEQKTEGKINVLPNQTAARCGAIDSVSV